MDSADLAKIAALYYIEGLTQEDLSHRFGISRASIGRLLRRAQDEGIVEIRVRQDVVVTADLERQLVERFGIQRAIIAVNHEDVDKQRVELARLVAAHLDRLLSDGIVVAVGMGRNVSAVSEYAIQAAPRKCTFVSAIGGSYRGGHTMNADHIARRLAARFGGESETLYAPALVGDPVLRQALLDNDTVRHTLDKARRADIALIGVGDMNENSNIVRMGWFSQYEIAQARLAGTVGDLMGYDFVDTCGSPSSPALQSRVIGLSLPDLRRIPNVIAIAAEPTKVTGILGALRTGVIDIIATSTSNALSVLSLDRVSTGDV